MGNIQTNEKRGIPRFKFRKNKGGGGSPSSSGGEDPTPEALAESLDELSTTDQIAELTEWQAWCKEHPHAKGMAARLRRIRLDEFLAKRLQEAHQKLGQHHAPVRPWLQRRHQHGHAAAAQHTAQQAYNAQQASIAAEAARIAAEAAAQAEAVRLLEESARLTAQAAVAQRAVEAAAQQVTQLEAQLVTAQAATQEAIQLTQHCAAQKAEVERTLESVHEHVTKKVTEYTAIIEKDKKSHANPLPHLNAVAHTLFLANSCAIRTAARVTAEHAKLQQVTVLELQKAIDALTQLAQQHVTHRTTAQEQTRAAVERATLAAANLTAQHIVAQQDAAVAHTQLMTLIHRITSQQQAEAQQRATASAHQTETPLRQEVAVDPTLSRQLLELQMRLAATQEKISQTKQALANIIAMKTTEQPTIISYDPNSLAYSVAARAFSTALSRRVQEYLLNKELAELQLENNPLAELAKQELDRVTAAGGDSLAIAYQALLLRKADKVVQQAQRNLTQLTDQQIELTQNIQQMTETNADQTAISVATQRMTELMSRITEAEVKTEEAQAEMARLKRQDGLAKCRADQSISMPLGRLAAALGKARMQEQHQTPSETQGVAIQKNILDKIDTAWDGQYSNAMTQAIDDHSINLAEPTDSGYQATIQNISRTLPPPESVPAFKSLELLFRCDFTQFPTFEDQRLHPATQLFMLDLLYLLIYHSPTMYHRPSTQLSDTINHKALFYIQHFLTTHPEVYQAAQSRLLKRLDARQYTTMPSKINPTTQLLNDIAIHASGLRVTGWELMESARVNLQRRAEFAKKRNHRFFSVTPEFRDQDNYFEHSKVDQGLAQFTAWIEGIHTTADSINLLDLPAEMQEQLRTMSKTLDQTEASQRTISI